LIGRGEIISSPNLALEHNLMVTVIKRYPNRKLYNTQEKRYINLEKLSDLIRGGEEVQVIDHVSGEDLTTMTLSQVIIEQEKRRTGFLPGPVLSGLIRAGGGTLDMIRRSLSLSLDIMRHVDDEIERRFNYLIEQGDLSIAEGKYLQEMMIAAGRKSLEKTLSMDAVRMFLKQRGIPSREDLQQLTMQVEALVQKVDELSQEKS
jgi:polyhydroxyalkanoate synthesis repressor PhaR